MEVILFLIALVLAVYGVMRLISGDILVGVLLLVAACLVGPGGYSIFYG